MKRKKRPASQSEAMKLRWKKRIVFEKGYTEQCAEWMAERLEALTDHLQYGHAVIAYRKQNGDFRLVKATLIYYEAEFHKKYDPTKI
ncbi:SH3 beta-barrel fold-containing protein, partial [Bacteroides fragilis]